jgi:hypothetical protein
MTAIKAKCARCAGDGSYYKYDGVGGRWEEHCSTCRGTGEVEVLGPVAPLPARDRAEARTLELAAAYREACKDVQLVWNALLAALAKDVMGAHAAERTAYQGARERAAAAREAMIKHASSGFLEVGA